MSKDDGDSLPPDAAAANDVMLERYKYILNEIHATNENVYRFLAIYQALATTLAAAGLALFVGYRKWKIGAPVARSGVIGLMWLITIIGAFVILLIVIGILSWLDYRREECELTDAVVRPGFRKPPQPRNFLRWYETYIVLFIIGSIVFLWSYTWAFILPSMN